MNSERYHSNKTKVANQTWNLVRNKAITKSASRCAKRLLKNTEKSLSSCGHVKRKKLLLRKLRNKNFGIRSEIDFV